MIDIILPIYNNLDYTILFIDSLLSQKNVQFTLIIINNWSTDWSEDFINSLIWNINIKVIHNSENLWYVKAINQWLQISTNPLILLCNNDIILSKDLLYKMSHVLSLKEYDIISPYTNLISWGEVNPLLIKYDHKITENNINTFSDDLFNTYCFNISNVEYVFGHCMMFSQEVLKKIWVLDENFWIGNYDDIDFCKRATNNGFKVGLLKWGFVYHFCHTTFHSLWIDMNELLYINKDIFDKKWY